MKRLLLLLVLAGVAAGGWYYWPSLPRPWTAADIEVLRSLSIDSLPALPDDPSNAVADDPRAADFGRALFFDTRLSGNGGISCATCHQPLRRFTDGLPQGQAIGRAQRNTPSIIGTAYSPWLYWDGRRDSQWSQALVPLEDPQEHGSDRRHILAVIDGDPAYRSLYLELFGTLPESSDSEAVNTAFANIGKAIAAYERLLLPGRSRFDDFVTAVLAGDESRQQQLFSKDEIVGLQLFIGAANCTRCHNGPLLSNNEFHNTGVLSYPGELPDKGRVAGVREVLGNEFSCKGPYNDDVTHSCAELDYVRSSGAELIGAFRTPSLRNLENTAPYMHQGQLASLSAVLAHYNQAPLAMIGHSELVPLKLRRSDLRKLEAFLHTLAAPPAVDAHWLSAPTRTFAAESNHPKQQH